MTAATRLNARTTATTTRAGHLALWIFLIANLAVVELMVATVVEPEFGPLPAIGRFLGLHLAFVMALQLLLIARLPFLDRRIGMDRLTSWHRWTGFAVFWLALLHPTFVILGFAQLEEISFGTAAVNMTGQLPILLGLVASGLVALVAVLSVRAARRRLSYEAWHTIHLLVYAVIVLGLIHQVYEGSSFNATTLTQAYWWGLWAFAIGALLVGRLVVPIVRNARHQLRVSAVVPESDDVVSVYVTGQHLDRLNARPGQFFLWRFPSHNGWLQVNPFSLSAAPDGRSLRLTAKGIGTTSSSLRTLPVGARVFAEGPYGAFTAGRRTRESTLLIAGGIGVTPIRSLLEDPGLTGDIVVLYRARSAAAAVLLSEMQNLAAVRGARLHLLTDPDSPPTGALSAEHLLSLVPDVTERDVFVCGPPGMTDAVLRTLRNLNVPARQQHAELFRLAG